MFRARFSSAEARVYRYTNSKGTRTQVDPPTNTVMAPRGPRPTLLLTLGLLAACLALTNGQAWVELNKIFNRHHVNYPRTQVPNLSNYCNVMMRGRGLYGTPVNTFIHASTQSINNICLRGGLPLPGSLYQSRRFFTITTCRYNLQNRSYIGTWVSRKIVIGCWNRLPVYYKE